MLETTDFYLPAVTFLLGLCSGGYAAYRLITPKNKRDLELELSKTKDALSANQAHMTDHFAHTASLLENLHRQHTALHEYISTTALQIGGVDIKPILASGNTYLIESSAHANPPLDYAASRSNIGTLSENFGLQEEPIKTQPPNT